MLQRIVLPTAWLLCLACTTLTAAELPFRDQELPTRLTVGYAVRLLDMNGDKRLDICIVDSDRILWLENPNWTEHVILPGVTKKDNVCFAPADIDGDGKVDFAIGADWQPNNTKSGGSIQWITGGASQASPWKLHPIGEYPTTHRMNFADLDADGKPELIVSPLKGKDTAPPAFGQNGTPLLIYKIPADPVKGPWTPEVVDTGIHVTHNFQVLDFDNDSKLDILIVSFEGVSLLSRGADGKWQRKHLGAGNQANAPPVRGSSEIKRGKLASGDYIATIEPWHGDQVVVYTAPDEVSSKGASLWTRKVLDDDLLWGHAVTAVNLDADADDELVIGVRDNHRTSGAKCGVRIFDPVDAAAGKWTRQLVDPGSVAIEDLAAGDLNGDGKADIVAVGRATKNVKIYWNESK